MCEWKHPLRACQWNGGKRTSKNGSLWPFQDSISPGNSSREHVNRVVSYGFARSGSNCLVLELARGRHVHLFCDPSTYLYWWRPKDCYMYVSQLFSNGQVIPSPFVLRYSFFCWRPGNCFSACEIQARSGPSTPLAVRLKRKSNSTPHLVPTLTPPNSTTTTSTTTANRQHAPKRLRNPPSRLPLGL